jgi:hypothetical protein
MKVNRIVAAASSAALLGALAACGGGGSGTGAPAQSSNPPPSGGLTAANSVSGKAIDGYLVGATVCIDENANGACDTGEPTTVTDANGNYTLAADSTATGKKLLVTVGPSTRDLSRPNFTFPASFTLSQIAQFGTTQNISPLTTMIVAQMETGLSQAQATAAVQTLIGSTIDPNADYVAGGDTATSSLATQIIDKMTSFATNGALDPAAVRNVLNAIVTAGNVASVTQADVDAQASKPVYAVADAAAILSRPTYSLSSYSVPYFSGGSTTQGATLQDVRQTVNGSLQVTQQERPFGSTTFQNIAGTTYYDYLTGAQDTPGSQSVVAGKYDSIAGEYQMKADGTWTSLLSDTQLHAALPLTTIGAALGGTDPNTGIGFTVEYRSVDVSGQPLSSAAPFRFGLLDLWTEPQLTGAQFSAGTKAYEGLLSHTVDQVILPVFLPSCAPPVVPGQTNCGNNQGVVEDGVVDFVAASPSTVYTSAQQAIGLSLVSSDASTTVVLQSNGQATINGQSISWTTYSRSPNVLVLDIPPATLASLTDGNVTTLTAPLLSGAKLVVALHAGHFQFGWLYLNTYADTSIQFSSNLPAQITSAIDALVAPN